MPEINEQTLKDSRMNPFSGVEKTYIGFLHGRIENAIQEVNDAAKVDEPNVFVEVNTFQDTTEFDGVANFNAAVDMDATLDVAQTITAQDDLNVGGDLAVTGTATVTSTSNLVGAVTANGGIGSTENISTTSTGKIQTTSTGGINSTSGNLKLQVGGTDEIEISGTTVDAKDNAITTSGNISSSAGKIQTTSTGGINSTSGNLKLQVGGTDEVEISGTTVDAKNNSIVTTGNLAIGSATTDQLLYVKKGASGRAWSSDAADLVNIESNTALTVNLITPNSQAAYILFSDDAARAVGQISYAHSTDTFTFTAGAAVQATLSTSALNLQNNTITTSGLITGSAGINCGNATNATASTLDYYEEGTFTPALGTDGTGFTTVTYSIQVGKYTRVGNLVTCTGRVQLSGLTVGAASGSYRITGLPFTAVTLTNYDSRHAIFVNRIDLPATTIQVGCSVTSNTNYLTLYAIEDDVASYGLALGVSNTTLSSTTSFMFTVSYFVTT